MGRAPGVQPCSVPRALIRGAVAPGGSVWVLRLPGVPRACGPSSWAQRGLALHPAPVWLGMRPATCALEAQTGKGTWGGQGRTVPACVGGRGRCREHQGWGSSETGLGCRVVGRPSLLLLGRGQRKDKVPGAGAGGRRPSSVQAVGVCWAVTMLFPSAR